MTSTTTNDINRSPEVWSAAQPHTSLIVACYRVAAYLPAFFSSLSAQIADHAGYELIFVIDGCPEDSELLVRSWMTTTDFAVRIVVKANGGVASARNAGLEMARGVWLSHPDPDDVLEPGYLHAVEHAQSKFSDATMFAGRAILVGPDGSEIRHTLDQRYEGATTSLIDLNAEPRKIHTLGGVAFFKRSIVDAHHLRFNEAILQSSDTDFIGHFLICNGAKYVIVPEARYLYFRRSDGSSIVSSQSGNMARYVSLFNASHRAMLDRAGDSCPPWLANLLLYFIFMLFRRNRSRYSPVDHASRTELAQIREILRANLQRIGVVNISAFDIFAVPLEFRTAWLAAVEPLETSPVEHLKWQHATGRRHVAIYSSHPFPPSNLRVASGTGSIPREKRRRIEFLGDTWVYQHVYAVTTPPLSGLALSCDDSFTLEHDGWVGTANQHGKRSGLASPIAVQPARNSFGERTTPIKMSSWPHIARAASRYISRGRVSWVFLAEPGQDTSQCEALHSYVRRAFPEIDLLFVAASRSAESARLRATGYAVSTIGSFRHLEAMHRAQYVFTPHISPASTNPFPWASLNRVWKVVLLPKAPIQPMDFRDSTLKSVDFVPATSVPELDRLTGPYSDFPFVRGESFVAGLPRHDLLEKARARENIVLIAPQWRDSLRVPTSEDEITLLRETRFVQEWNTLLSSESLRAFASRYPGRVVFQPPSQVDRPNQIFEVPSWLSTAPAPDDISILGATQVLLTDYSPRAFDVAYLQRPTVYFQFDAESVLGASDSPLNCAADFRNRGFGPVADTASVAVDWIERLVDAVPAEYQLRLDRAYTFRDGNACARLTSRLTDPKFW